MNMNKERNCYSCREYEHIARNYRNWKIIGQERKLEYKDNMNIGNNLNRKI